MACEHMFVSRRKRKERAEARRLRSQGWSLRRIAVELGVSLSSVSVWVRDLPKPFPRTMPRRKRSGPRAAAPKGTRRCGRCGVMLPLAAFNRNGTDRQWWCRECFRSYFRERGQLHRDQCAAGKKRRVALAIDFIDEYLSASGCRDCGLRDADVLEFDHVGKKKGEISHLVFTGPSVRSLLAEMARCEVVCANCHRRRTARRAGSWRATGSLECGRNALPHERRAIEFVRTYLLQARCIDCACSDLPALDFDHVEEKHASVIKLARDGYSISRIQEEIDRCEIRCANCHRRRTRRQLGHRERESKLVGPP